MTDYTKLFEKQILDTIGQTDAPRMMVKYNVYDPNTGNSVLTEVYVKGEEDDFNDRMEQKNLTFVEYAFGGSSIPSFRTQNTYVEKEIID